MPPSITRRLFRYAAKHSEGALPNLARSAFYIIGNLLFEIKYYLYDIFIFLGFIFLVSQPHKIEGKVLMISNCINKLQLESAILRIAPIIDKNIFRLRRSSNRKHNILPLLINYLETCPVLKSFTVSRIINWVSK
jgi:hypothetical protein